MLRVVEALTLGTDDVRSAQEAFCELPGQWCVNGLLTAPCVFKTLSRVAPGGVCSMYVCLCCTESMP